MFQYSFSNNKRKKRIQSVNVCLRLLNRGLYWYNSHKRSFCDIVIIDFNRNVAALLLHRLKQKSAIRHSIAVCAYFRVAPPGIEQIK
jgi:hypothetical protein